MAKTSKERLAAALESIHDRMCLVEELLAQNVEHQANTNAAIASLQQDVATDLQEIKKIQRELGPLLDRTRDR